MRHCEYLRAAPLRAALLVTALFASGPAAAQTCGDVNNSGSVTSSDALNVLRAAVGQPVDLVCTGECAALEPRVDDLEAALASALDTIEGFQALLAGVSRTEDALVISGANLQVVDGTGNTAGPVNGLGNVIIGYNEGTEGQARTGSHNLVVGPENDYTSFGGIVAGEGNTIAARVASVLGGSANTASGPFSTVAGGFANTSSGTNAAIAGGCESTASGTYSATSGGQKSVASATWASVSGGFQNSATAMHSSVSGGSTHTAAGQFNWKAGTLSEAQ